MEAQVSHLMRLLKNSLYNKIYRLRWHLLNAFLDNMISVLIVYTVYDCIFKFLNQELLLF
jgi:hypothetical protein